MGNSCRRSEAQVISEAERLGQRGRWSVADGQSVDLDALIDAPSPPPQKKKKHRNGRRRHKHRSRNRSSPRAREHTTDQRPQHPNHPNHPNHNTHGHNTHTRKQKPRVEVSNNANDHYHHSPMDSDLILGTPPGSPEVIHARWGEPAEDPDEQSVCLDFRPNPFKLGWCVNCQRQHDVTETGVASKKEYKKIARPAISKHAANALDNPDAVKNISERRESDVDLAALLRQRRDILLKLSRMESEKKNRKHHGRNRPPPTSDPLRRSMFTPSERGSSIGKVILIDSSKQSNSYRIQRGASVTAPSLEPPMLSKSVSVGSRLTADEFPIESQWL